MNKKDFDITDCIVEGYFARFDIKDSHNDVFVKGAFLKSIAEKGPESEGNRKIAHLAFHDVTKPIAKILELKEDERGLYFKSELVDTEDGEDAKELYKKGVINEHSVGYLDVPNGSIKKKNYTEISEVDLFEGSMVVFGSNSETLTLSKQKSLILESIDEKTIEEQIDILNKKTEKLIADFNKFNGNELMFEFEMKSIAQHYEFLLKQYDKKTKTRIKLF